MMEMKKVFGGFGLLAVLLIIIMPVYGAKPSITYFNANDPKFASACVNGFTRSTSPIRNSGSTFGIFQQGNLHGAVVMSISALDTQTAIPYVTVGFSIYNVGKLAEIHTIRITADPDSFRISGAAVFQLNLWLDVSGQGEYYVWSHNCLTSLGTTVTAQGPVGNSPTITITGTTTFSLFGNSIPSGSTATLADLKAGSVPGIDPATTEVAIWVGIGVLQGTTGSGNAVISPSGISIS